MFTPENTYGDVIDHPLLKEISQNFIVNYSLESNRNATFGEVEEKGGWFCDVLLPGLNQLVERAATGEYRYPLYSEEEIKADPEKSKTDLVWFPSEDPAANDRPFVIVVPGGGYVNVWNLTEGYPIAAHFNRIGYHAFILTYRVNVAYTLPKALEDYSRALDVIREKKDLFRVDPDRYYTTGFSAGAHLICAWGMSNHGYSAFDKPAPIAMFPIYPPVSWRIYKTRDNIGFAHNALCISADEAANSDWNIEDHVENYPPCYIVCTTDDALVDPEHSRILKRALDAAGIPAMLEEKPRGGHGFGEGLHADTKGWIERAVSFAEQFA